MVPAFRMIAAASLLVASGAKPVLAEPLPQLLFYVNAALVLENLPIEDDVTLCGEVTKQSISKYIHRYGSLVGKWRAHFEPLPDSYCSDMYATYRMFFENYNYRLVDELELTKLSNENSKEIEQACGLRENSMSQFVNEPMAALPGDLELRFYAPNRGNDADTDRSTLDCVINTINDMLPQKQ